MIWFDDVRSICFPISLQIKSWWKTCTPHGCLSVLILEASTRAKYSVSVILLCKMHLWYILMKSCASLHCLEQTLVNHTHRHLRTLITWLKYCCWSFSESWIPCYHAPCTSFIILNYFKMITDLLLLFPGYWYQILQRSSSIAMKCIGGLHSQKQQSREYVTNVLMLVHYSYSGRGVEYCLSVCLHLSTYLILLIPNNSWTISIWLLIEITLLKFKAQFNLHITVFG